MVLLLLKAKPTCSFQVRVGLSLGGLEVVRGGVTLRQKEPLVGGV